MTRGSSACIKSTTSSKSSKTLGISRFIPQSRQVGGGGGGVGGGQLNYNGKNKENQGKREELRLEKEVVTTGDGLPLRQQR